MADDTALGDLLSGAAGRPFDRLGSNAFVANSQAQNGLRTAQTEDALLTAQRMREESDASDQLNDTLANLTGPDGKPMMTPSQAQFTATQMKFLHGGAQPALEAIGQMQKNNQSATIANTSADPNARLAADQALNPGANPYQAVGDQVVSRFAPNTQAPGQPAPVQSTPTSTANDADKNADAQLKIAEATNPGAFHPSSVAGQLDPNATEFRAQGIANGQLPAPSQYEWTKNPKGASAVMARVNELNPQFTQSLQPQIASTIKDFAGGGKNGQALQGYRTVDSHLGLLADAATAVNNTDVQGVNSIKNHLATFFGETAPVAANMLPQFIATETMRALARNSIGSQAERDEAQQKINVMNQGPDQQKAAIASLKSILAGGRSSLEASYNSGTMGMAGHPGTPTFDEIYTGKFSGAPTPGSGGDAATLPTGKVLNYDPATGTFK